MKNAYPIMLNRRGKDIWEETMKKERVVKSYRQLPGLLAEYRYLAVMALYAVFYLAAFAYLEKRDVAVHEINLWIDEQIPFCEVFVVPYLLWFGYVALTVVYLCIKDKEEGGRLVLFLMAGMTIFIVVSAIYPNGHNLRPTTFARDNIFIDLIKNLYAADTPTNILPSIHVYNSVAVMIAVRRSGRFAGHRIFKYAMLGLGASIICATVLIKQHSMLDVLLALLLSALMYSVFYKRADARAKSVVARVK